MDILIQDGATYTLLTVDVVTEQRHSLRAVMTEFPVERDADRSDHHRKVLDDFTIEVVVTNTPVTGSADQLLFRTREVWAQLEDARDRHLPCVITTDLKTYGEDVDLVLKEATTTITAKDGSWIRASLTFGQMALFSSELVNDPVATRPRDQRTTDIGSQSTVPMDEGVRQSLLFQAQHSDGGAQVVSFFTPGH